VSEDGRQKKEVEGWEAEKKDLRFLPKLFAPLTARL